MTPYHIHRKIEELKKEYDTVNADGIFVIVSKNGLYGCLHYDISKDSKPKAVAIPLIYKSIVRYSSWFFIVETEDGFSIIRINPKYEIVPFRNWQKFTNRNNLSVIKGYYNGDNEYRADSSDWTERPITIGQEAFCNLLVERADNKIYFLDSRFGERLKGYDNILFSFGFYETILNNKHGVINTDGEIIFDCEYDKIDFDSTNNVTGIKIIKEQKPLYP